MAAVLAAIGTPSHPPKQERKVTLSGLQDNLAVVKSVALLSKKALFAPKNNSQTLLESLTVVF